MSAMDVSEGPGPAAMDTDASAAATTVVAHDGRPPAGITVADMQRVNAGQCWTETRLCHVLHGWRGVSGYLAAVWAQFGQPH